MFEDWRMYFNTEAFMPHGHCFLWRPGILWMHIVSDTLIALAYFLIPLALIRIVRNRSDLAFSGIFLLFAAFIVACGITHVFGIWTIWIPAYGIEGLIKLATAFVSIGTAAAIWMLIPNIIAFPGVTQYKALCQKLENEAATRKDAQAALERRANQLRLIVNQLPVAICYLDNELVIRYCNATYARWQHKSKGQILGRHMKEILSEQALQRTAGSVVRALAGDSVRTDDMIQFKDKDRFVSIQDMPDVDSHGKVQGVIRLITDLSPRIEVENELRKAKEAAEVSNIAKSAFVANISHEIRTPLGAVVGFSDILTRNNISQADRQKYICAVKRNSELLLHIIDDILDISKMEAGKIVLSDQEVDLHDTISDINTFLQQKCAEKKLNHAVHAEDSLPQFIGTDPHRLNQVLINLIGNAIKFSRSGTIEVRVGSLSEAGQPTKIGFWVRDQGIGISHEQAAHLFEPFFQGDMSATRSYGGTGLGLNLSKRLAQLLGGDIQLVSSEEGQGSVFLFTVTPSQVRGQYASAVTSASDHSKAPVLVLSNGGQLRGTRILLAEDAVDNQALISTYLEAAGAAVKIANNGKEAVEIVKEDNFDVVLMDLQMPVMSGYDALAQLRKDGCHLPIIALTAHTMQFDKEKCADAGFDGHIGKPVNYNQLMLTLMQYSQPGEHFTRHQ